MLQEHPISDTAHEAPMSKPGTELPCSECVFPLDCLVLHVSRFSRVPFFMISCRQDWCCSLGCWERYKVWGAGTLLLVWFCLSSNPELKPGVLCSLVWREQVGMSKSYTGRGWNLKAYTTHGSFLSLCPQAGPWRTLAVLLVWGSGLGKDRSLCEQNEVPKRLLTPHQRCGGTSVSSKLPFLGFLIPFTVWKPLTACPPPSRRCFQDGVVQNAFSNLRCVSS